MNKKQNVRIKIEQVNVDIFQNEILLDPMNCLC